MAIEWTQKLAVGVASIDMQHRELVDRVNGLVAALEARKGIDEVRRLVTFLGDYVVTHFGAEERLMQQHHYPEYPGHKQLHEHLVKDLAKIRAELEKTGPTPALAVALNTRLGHWLVDHIMAADQAFGRWLAAHKPAG